MKMRITLPIIILTLAALACTLPSLPDILGGGDSTPTDPNILFQDDFTDSGSGWDEYSDADGSTGYANGSYRVQVLTTDLMLWGNPYQDFQNDVRVTVEATKAGGPDDNALGLICRYQDLDNFYLFIISSDGYAGIAMYQASEFTILSGEYLEPTEAILQGAATNRIEAACIGTSLALVVNGTQVTSVSDASFTGGDVGLFAKSFTEGNVDILFDNLVVSKP